MTRVTFVSHEATLTGAPVGLVQLLGWLAEHTDVATEVVILEDGPLAGSLGGVAPVRTVEDLVTGPPPDVLFLNSTFSASVLLRSDFPGSRVIARVPELGFAIGAALDPEVLAAVLARADRFVAVSEAVRRHLVGERGVDATKVVVVHGAVPISSDPVDPEAVAEVRRDLGVPPRSPLIGSVGAIHWRKGPDLFVQLAATLARRTPDRDAHFVWVGADPSGEPTRRVAAEAERSGLGDRVHLVAAVDDPTPYQAAMDVFVSTSREDPFPRVCLEAAALRRPIVAFASGGVEDLLADVPGQIVAYEDVEAMADRVVGLLDDPAGTARMTEQLRHIVATRFDLDTSARALLDEIQPGG